MTNVIDLTHKLKSGSVATNGIGTGINFKSVLTDGSMPSLGSVDFVTINASNSVLLSSKIVLNAVNSGVEQQVFAIDNSGDIEVGDGSTPCSITSTGGQNIQFDSTVVTNGGLSANQTGSSAQYNVSPLTVRGQTTSGTPSAGSATSIPYYMEVRAGVNKFLSRLKTICTDNVLDEEKGDFVIELLNNTGVSGNAEEKFRTISDGNIQIQGPNLYKKQTGASISIAGPATYTAENILSGLIIRDCNGSSRTDTLITGLGPTGLVQNIPNATVGTTFNLTIANISGTGEDITLQQVLNFAEIRGITTIKAGESINAQIVVTDISGGAEKYIMYTLSSVSGSNSDGTFTITDTILNSVSIPVTLKHLISAGTILTGIGTGMDFVTETTAGEEIGMSLTSVSTNIGAGTEAFDFVLNLMTGGATADEALRVTSDKILTVPTGGNMFLPDNAEIKIGNTAAAPHSYIRHDGSNFEIGNNTGNTGNIIIRTQSTHSSLKDVHIRLSNDDGTSNFLVKTGINANVLNVPSDGASIHIKRDTSASNRTRPLTLYHKLISPTIAQAGIGTELTFNCDLTDVTSGHDIGQLLFRTIEDDSPAQAGDTTDAKLKSRFVVKNYNAGIEQNVLEIDNTGLFTVGNSSVPCTIKSQTTDLILASASDKQCKIRDADGSVQIQGPQTYKRSTVSDITTAGDETYTGAQILNGLITRDCSGASRNDSVPTYADLTNALGFSDIGSTFELIICNISDAHDEDLFIRSNGTGTVVGINRIPKGTNMKFTGVITTGSVYTLFSHGQKEFETVNVDSSAPYVRTITGTNHTWTPEELMYGTVRRTTGGLASEDILPNPSLLTSSYPQLKTGDKINLTIIKTDNSANKF